MALNRTIRRAEGAVAEVVRPGPQPLVHLVNQCLGTNEGRSRATNSLSCRPACFTFFREGWTASEGRPVRGENLQPKVYPRKSNEASASRQTRVFVSFTVSLSRCIMFHRHQGLIGAAATEDHEVIGVVDYAGAEAVARTVDADG